MIETSTHSLYTTQVKHYMQQSKVSFILWILSIFCLKYCNLETFFP